MIEGAWSYIWGAYGVVVIALVVLTSAVILRLMHWAKCAQEERRP